MVSAALPFPKKTATESVSNSGIEWLSSSAKRQCDQTPQVIIEGLATLVTGGGPPWDAAHWRAQCGARLVALAMGRKVIITHPVYFSIQITKEIIHRAAHG